MSFLLASWSYNELHVQKQNIRQVKMIRKRVLTVFFAISFDLASEKHINAVRGGFGGPSPAILTSWA